MSNPKLVPTNETYLPGIVWVPLKKAVMTDPEQCAFSRSTPCTCPKVDPVS